MPCEASLFCSPFDYSPFRVRSWPVADTLPSTPGNLAPLNPPRFFKSSPFSVFCKIPCQTVLASSGEITPSSTRSVKMSV
jgi:hypothetical protein